METNFKVVLLGEGEARDLVFTPHCTALTACRLRGEKLDRSAVRGGQVPPVAPEHAAGV